MTSSEYMFAVSLAKISRREAARRDAIARKHGGNFVGPLTTAGNEGKSWYAIPNKGEPFNGRISAEILAEVAAS
jgi:hypothetical protein